MKLTNKLRPVEAMYIINKNNGQTDLTNDNTKFNAVVAYLFEEGYVLPDSKAEWGIAPTKKNQNRLRTYEKHLMKAMKSENPSVLLEFLGNGHLDASVLGQSVGPQLEQYRRIGNNLAKLFPDGEGFDSQLTDKSYAFPSMVIDNPFNIHYEKLLEHKAKTFSNNEKQNKK